MASAETVRVAFKASRGATYPKMPGATAETRQYPDLDEPTHLRLALLQHKTHPSAPAWPTTESKNKLFVNACAPLDHHHHVLIHGAESALCFKNEYYQISQYDYHTRGDHSTFFSIVT